MAGWRLGWPLLKVAASLHRRTLARRTHVTVVVGTLGKTTTTRAVAAALGLPERRPGSNAWSSVAARILSIRPNDRYAVVEVGVAKPGEMAAYTHMIRPDVTVVTSIGTEHRTSFRTTQAGRQEKCRMVEVLPRSGTAVLNGDDPDVRWMAGRARAQVLTYGFGPDNDVRASDVRLDWPHGTRFSLHVGGARHEVRTRLIGWPMVYPVLAGVTVARAEGISVEAALGGLAALPPTPGRLEPVPLPGGAMALNDCFKSAFETVEAALEVLSEIPARRRMVVLGRISEPLASAHRLYRTIGRRLVHIGATTVVFVGPSTGREALAAGLKRAGGTHVRLEYAGRSVVKAAEALPEDLGPGDVVLLKAARVERLERVLQALNGRRVRCGITECRAWHMGCATCPMLERGWDGVRTVT
jgi:UDP-N-acetylmuramoyl-tripeptide--D-alanyl-D-alanine ligase